jgi:hypothetical protein
VAKIVLPDVGGIIESLRLGVERRLGRRRRLYTGEDLIDDVGLSEEQFEELIDELEEELSVEIDPETLDQLTVAGALLVRLLRLRSRPFEEEAADRAAA